MPVSEAELDFVYELQRTAGRYDMTYVYNGAFSESLSDGILSLTEANLDDGEVSSKVRKKVYFLMVESLQNITRHQDPRETHNGDVSSFFLISRKGNDYIITSGNCIDNDRVPTLKEFLEELNGLDKESLKSLQRQILSEGELSEKGGAGLGLIEMARKSGNKLYFDFKPLDENRSYFYFQTKVLGDSPNLTGGMKELQQNIGFHQSMVKKNIGIIYQGEFSQDNMLNLLGMAENNLGKEIESVRLRKKIFHITVELLQNILKYADILAGDKKERQGIFFIGSKNDQYFICAGNPIKDEKIELLKGKLEEVNSLSKEQLEDKYATVLKKREQEDNLSNGLGFLDLKSKAGSELIYSFTSLSDGNSLYSIQVNVSDN